MAIAEPSEVPIPPVVEVPRVATSTPPVVTEPREVLCNCWRFVKEQFPSLPSAHTVLTNLATSGPIAVFYYPQTGLYHYAVILSETESSFSIEETNYHRCKHSKRIIPKTDKRLIGFYTP